MKRLLACPLFFVLLTVLHSSLGSNQGEFPDLGKFSANFKERQPVYQFQSHLKLDVGLKGQKHQGAKTPGVKFNSGVNGWQDTTNTIQFEAKADEGSENILHPFVRTTGGLYQGKRVQSREGRNYYSFTGIPYAAQPPRFQRSVLINDSWTGVRDARTCGSPCPQLDDTKVIGDENCLFLNVYTPSEERCSGKLPVMCNIHGGSFLNGIPCNYYNDNIMSECVVFVSINYRLGALGFSCSEDGEIPGNLGLLDCITALKWIQREIGNFRGDPNRVTILGISAGASAVSHLIASKMAEGLFHRGISQSGTTMNSWSVAKTPRATLEKLAVKCNCSTNATKSMADCLKEKSMSDIIQNQATFVELGPSGAEVLPLAPAVETWGNETQVFQNENPAVRLREGRINKVDCMVGFTQDEGIAMVTGEIMANPMLTMLLNFNWENLGPSLLMVDKIGLKVEDQRDIARRVWAYYLGNGTINESTRQNLTDLCSDRSFVQGTFEFAQLASKWMNVYPYVMTFKGGSSYAEEYYGYETPQITHADDGQYFYSSKVYGPHMDQYKFSRNLVKFWTSFAADGIPKGEGPAWPAIANGTRSNSKWYKLDEPCGVLDNYLEDRRQFWESLKIYEKEFY